MWKDIVFVNGKETIIQYFTYERDVFHGQFKSTEKETIFIGNYKDGELHGLYKVYKDYLTKSGELLFGDISKAYLSEEGYYENGKKNGKWKYYNENKILLKEVVFIDDIEQ